METIGNILTFLTAALHGYFFFLEMYLWQTPLGLKIFGQDAQKAAASATLAANQGFYNGMLAVGLLASFIVPDMGIRYYCLIFISLAGLYGWYSTGKVNIFVIQSVPALLALGFYLGR